MDAARSGPVVEVVQVEVGRVLLQSDLVAAVVGVVQLNFTPDMEVFSILFERSLSTYYSCFLRIFSMTSITQHIEYFRCIIQLDIPVVGVLVAHQVRIVVRPVAAAA